ncbi:MAG: citrate synthase [Planctomycetes bacterium]|nr:citrate synthase [Planctomycetota bacterium]
MQKALLKWNGQEAEFPVLEGTEGEMAIDFTKLRQQVGLVSFDPGYGNTASCKSAITFIDGEKGILKYRGIPIEELAEKATFLETAYLLIWGKLPEPAELKGFLRQITAHTLLHEDVKRFYTGFPKDAHPMAVCSAVVAALSAFYPELLDPRGAEAEHGAIIRLLAKFPTIAAFSYKHSIGQPFIYPDNKLDYTSNFLRMMFATPCEDYRPDPVAARTLDLLLILHADHEQNCSTSTVRLVGSSLSNLFASISAGINALWGPLHGGANQKVLEMLESIEKGGGSVEAFVEKAKSKNDTARLMGFGHRVYKNYDPRAKIIRKACYEVLNKLGVRTKLLEIAVKLEEIALKDDYFLSRRLYPNVDFYSGIIYQALEIPINMFTVLFAMGRLPGWIAHWDELQKDPDFKIGRPRQIFVGPTGKHYLPIGQRKQ